MKVSYLGPKGSFSEIALSTYFGNNITAIPMPSIGDVFQAVVKNESACTACLDCVQACPEGAITVEE